MPSGVYIRTPEIRERCRVSAIKRFEDPKEREKHSKAMKGALLKYYRDPKNRKKQSERMKIANNRPEVREKISKATKIALNRPEVKERHKKAMKIAANRPEVKEKLRKAMKGKPGRAKGKHWKCSEKARANMKGHCGAYKHKPLLEEHKKNIKIALNKPDIKEKQKKAMKIAWNKPERRKKSSEFHKGKPSGAKGKHWQIPEKLRKNWGEIHKIVSNRPETKAKHRKAWEKRAESSGYPRKYFKPNFNFESIPIFKALDRVLHTRSRYGGTEAGERKIGRYFVDCFNEEYQFIIEWNENWHYDSNYYPEGYDTKKREYILARHPDYTYIIIRQDRWFKRRDLTEEIAGEIVDYVLKKLNEEKVIMEIISK